MASYPASQKIWHITHLNNLAGIVESGVLWSDAKRAELGLNCEVVGMSKIKERRLIELEVGCYAGTKVGDYVPFYFCPRSVMLYILYMGNNPDLHYRGGQEPIVHLQADIQAVIDWADGAGIRWAFSDRNAGARIATFYSRKVEFKNLNWDAIENRDFRDFQVKEGKQAEFLVFESFPWTLVEHIGVHSEDVARTVTNTIAANRHRPPVTVRPDWYY
jgi:hypothetical protein